jgi:hypothetical protein
MNTGVSRLVFSLAKRSFFIILFLATSWAASEGISLVVGLWVGFVLAWGHSDSSAGIEQLQITFICGGLLAGCLCWSHCLSLVLWILA